MFAVYPICACLLSLIWCDTIKPITRCVEFFRRSTKIVLHILVYRAVLIIGVPGTTWKPTNQIAICSLHTTFYISSWSHESVKWHHAATPFRKPFHDFGFKNVYQFTGNGFCIDFLGIFFFLPKTQLFPVRLEISYNIDNAVWCFMTLMTREFWYFKYQFSYDAP